MNPTPPPGSAPDTLRARFCAHHQCPECDFERVFLRRCLHTPWRFFAPLVLKLRPQAFATDRAIIGQLSRVSTATNLRAELKDLRSDYRRFSDFGWFRRLFRFRLSATRILDACLHLWPRSAKASPPPLPDQ